MVLCSEKSDLREGNRVVFTCKGTFITMFYGQYQCVSLTDSRDVDAPAEGERSASPLVVNGAEI